MFNVLIYTLTIATVAVFINNSFLQINEFYLIGMIGFIILIKFFRNEIPLIFNIIYEKNLWDIPFDIRKELLSRNNISAHGECENGRRFDTNKYRNIQEVYGIKDIKPHCPNGSTIYAGIFGYSYPKSDGYIYDLIIISHDNKIITAECLNNRVEHLKEVKRKSLELYQAESIRVASLGRG